MPVPIVVLDTNVCLDLFLFRDPACMPLLAALRRGQLRAVTRQDCHEEWCAVLHYPQLPITVDNRPAIAAAYDALVSPVTPAPAPAPAPATIAQLPRCADPDDQKFMELALAVGARWLFSKDKELLKLGPRTRNAGWFDILLPQDWALID